MIFFPSRKPPAFNAFFNTLDAMEILRDRAEPQEAEGHQHQAVERRRYALERAHCAIGEGQLPQDILAVGAGVVRSADEAMDIAGAWMAVAAQKREEGK